jgi:hypothetical protein
MKVLDRKTVEEIYEVMNDLDAETLNNSEHYVMHCFSVFDHWLSEDEYCEKSVICYSDTYNDADKLQQYNVFEKTFLNFYLDLYNKTTVYGLFSPAYGPSAIVVFDSIEEYKSHILLSIREQLFLQIVMPEYCAVIKGNFDLTHLLYTMKSKPESLSKISEIIKANGLFILS